MSQPHDSLSLPGALPAEATVQSAGAEDRRGVPWGRPAGAAVQSGAASPDPTVPAGHGAAPEEAFEPDYLRWREAQLRALDDDYRAWREQGGREPADDFAGRFTRWRATRAGRSGETGAPHRHPDQTS